MKTKYFQIIRFFLFVVSHQKKNYRKSNRIKNQSSRWTADDCVWFILRKLCRARASRVFLGATGDITQLSLQFTTAGYNSNISWRGFQGNHKANMFKCPKKMWRIPFWPNCTAKELFRESDSQPLIASFWWLPDQKGPLVHITTLQSSNANFFSSPLTASLTGKCRSQRGLVRAGTRLFVSPAGGGGGESKIGLWARREGSKHARALF